MLRTFGKTQYDKYFVLKKLHVSHVQNIQYSGRPIVEFWLSADTDTIGQKPILSADCIGRLFTNKKHRILSTFYFEAVLTCTENWHAWNFLCILGFFNVFPFEKKTLSNFFLNFFTVSPNFFLKIHFFVWKYRPILWEKPILGIGRYYRQND